MPQLFKNKKIYIVIIITIILIWTVNQTSQPRKQMSYPEKVVGYVVLPVQKAFNYIYLQINEAYDFFQKIGSLEKQNEELKVKVQVLKDEIRQLKDIKRENKRLRKMLELKQKYDKYVFESAQVIGRNPENWNSIILINKGSNDGLKVDSQVLSLNKGLIGKIIDIGPRWSKIMLITDPDSSVSSMVESTRDLAVVRGSPLTSKNGLLKLTYILPDAKVNKGDTIITSGFGGIFSKGILIGKVQEIKKESNELIKSAYVKPAADFRRLEEVLVIKSVKE